MDPEQRLAVLRDLGALARSEAGDAATVEVMKLDGLEIWILDVTPVRTDARSISIIAEQWLVVQVGEVGGRFELDWTAEGIAVASDIVRGVIAGQVTERFGRSRSHVAVTTPDGLEYAETGIRIDGCLSALVPNPGWQRRGRLRAYAPYRE
jgi:hypothetical protein